MAVSGTKERHREHHPPDPRGRHRSHHRTKQRAAYLTADSRSGRPWTRARASHQPGCTVSSSPRQHTNPAGCYDRRRTAHLARCGNRLGDPVRTRGRIHRAESLTDPGRRRRKLPQVDPIGTLLADRRNLHHNAAQYLALPNVGLHRFHRGRGSSWPADPGLRGDCRTRRCSNGVVTPRWRMVFSLAPWRAAALRACCPLRARQ